ncbi:glycine cleavage system protein GcvH [Yinghuangia sp. ASG 101]|uniref:glycine cleavage system protein GcvH n=1 Tax=Yinghuangia sp. ASG 101 TaxID=2896848 RepID=UPI001E46A4E3|nr:glycine cleavage system protein GcvH [Yinghuangia sp. ASG 101]UGQ12579.1 glycine cleavage system protein GcvH [Yinghuangia sp. ASG 101]
MANVPRDRAYTRDHLWVRHDGRTALVGLTDFAQRRLGDIVYVELPNAGDRFEAGQPLGSVESVKTVSAIAMPVPGEVRDPNRDLTDMPESINDDPYGDGWWAEIDAADPSAYDGLLSADEYAAYLDESDA